MNFAKIIIVLTTISAAVMELLDTSIVNVALYDMAGGLGVNVEDVAWVITSYAIANVIIIPLTSFLAEYFGRKSYYVASMILFTAASFLCGNSHSLVELVFWRFVQGIGGGALLSTSQAIIFETFGKERQAMASGIFGMGIILGPTLGPTVGGYVMESLSWPWIFYINIPIGILATFLSSTFIERKPNEGDHKESIKIDYAGILFLSVGVGSLQFVLERGEADDWFASDAIRILTVSAVVGLSLFIWRELTTAFPAVKLSILRNRTQAVTNIFVFVLGIGLFTSVYVFPVMVQRINGFTPLETGLSILLPTFAGVILFPLIGRAMGKGAPAMPFIIIGSIMFGIFGIMGGSMTADANRSDFFYVLIFRTFGISLVQLPLISQAVQGLNPKDYPAAIGLNNMVRQLGGAFGIAMANNYVASHYAQHRADLIANVYQTNPLVTERLNGITNSILSKTGDLATATQQATNYLNFAVDKQAYLLSYLDTFRLISIFFVGVMPLVFLIPRPKKVSQTEAILAKKAMEEAH